MQHAQMPSAALTGRRHADLTLQAGSGVGDRRPRSLSNRIGERLEIVWSRAGRLGEVEPDDLPAEGRRQPSRMPGAQVVAMRLGVRRERAEHRRRFGVDIRERGDSGLPTCGARAAAKRAHVRER
jgi:hypothetical protein